MLIYLGAQNVTVVTMWSEISDPSVNYGGICSVWHKR